jgi:very-short-patch-repair endonuclease
VRLDDDLLALAQSQQGVLSTSQLAEAGIHAQRLHRLVQSGRLERIGTSCVRFPGHPPAWRQQLRIGLLDLGDDTLVARRAAACLLRLDGFNEGPVAFLAPRSKRNRSTVGEVHTSASIAPIDRTEAEGFPCTSATRTIIDVAAEATIRELENAVDSALRLGWTSEVYLRHQLTRLRHRGRGGVRALDRVLDGAGGHSYLERRFLDLVRRAGLPKPKTQRVHRLGGRFLARTDFSWHRTKVIVEVAGHATHATRQQRTRDAHRHAELSVLGWLVLTFTYEHVTRQPEWVLDVLTRAFRSRSIADGATNRD